MKGERKLAIDGLILRLLVALKADKDTQGKIAQAQDDVAAWLAKLNPGDRRDIEDGLADGRYALNIDGDGIVTLEGGR